MPLYRGTSYKRWGADKLTWQNVYLINEANALEALDVLNAIVGHEQAVHYNSVEFIRARVVNVANSADGRSVGSAGMGDLDPAALGGYLPLFNTVRVTFSDNVKRPESKYLRLPGNEDNLENGQWSTELTDYIGTNYVTPLLALTAFVGPSLEHPSSGSVQQAVQSRQLGWHRRTRPGFRRGWVPV
jgi:hypothetical protein